MWSPAWIFFAVSEENNVTVICNAFPARFRVEGKSDDHHCSSLLLSLLTIRCALTAVYEILGSLGVSIPLHKDSLSVPYRLCASLPLLLSVKLNWSNMSPDLNPHLVLSLPGVDAPGAAGPSLCVREGRGCSHLGHSTPLKPGKWSLSWSARHADQTTAGREGSHFVRWSWARAEKEPGVVVARIFWAAPCPMTSAAMTTAVQPTELVFEFASNGMDEINQVSITLERLHFNPVVCCFYAWLGL